MGRTELILFVALILTGVSVYLFLTSLMNNNNEKDLLAWAKGEDRPPTQSKIINSSIPMVHQFTMKHALKIKNIAYRKKVENILMTSGMSRQLSVDEFIGLRLLYGVMFPCFLFIMSFALELGLPLILFILLMPMGYYLPDIHANGIRKMRMTSVQMDLPFFIDLLALSTEAGLDFINAIQRIVDKAENSSLGDELAIVLKDIKLGSSRIEALRGMAKRLDMSEITSFIAVLSDADSTGASIAGVLKDQSVQMRLERFIRAEKAGAKASQLILLPIMVFIIPAVFIMVFGPVVIQFMSGGSN